MSLSIERNVYSEYAEKLEIIERLCAQPITEEVHEDIIQTLDEIHQNLSQCDTTAAKTNMFAQSYLKELQEKAVFLYGKVDDSFHQHEIDVIKEETASLAVTVKQKDLLRIATVLESLKAHINHLLETYSPALSERRVLVYAKMTLENAEALLQGQIVQELDLDIDEQEIEGILEELAEYLGNNDKVSLSLLWKRLSPVQKKLVMGYMTDPQDLLSCLLHNIEGSADYEQVFGG